MPVYPDYLAHLAAGNGRETACGEPWQAWQEPADADLAQPSHHYRTAPGPADPPRPGIDTIRQCQACLRVAMAYQGPETPQAPASPGPARLPSSRPRQGQRGGPPGA